MRHSICCGTTNHGMKKVCVFPKDVVRITGLSLRKAQSLLQNIRFLYSKKKHQYVTIKEFCNYTGIDEDSIKLD